MGVGLGVGGAATDGCQPWGKRCCPFCRGVEVVRLWLASASLDSCECTACWARWEEGVDGSYRGRVAIAVAWGSFGTSR